MENELYHHGIIGMKWGVRRYQNRDGTLTAAGRKRAAKLQRDYTKLTGKKISDSKEEAPKKKTISDFSDDELRARMNRLQMERNYLDLQKQVSALNPPQVSAGKKFVQNSLGKVIAPAAIEAGKKLLTEYVNKKGKELLGLDTKEAADGLDALGKEYKRLNYKKQINELNKYFDAEKKKASNSSDEAPKKEEPKKEERVYEGIVEDEETSRRTRSYNDGPRPTSSPIDVDFEDVDTGRRYIAGLLEDPRKKKK